jgi:hypothetical protein
MKTTIDMALEAGILEPIELLDSNQWRQDTIRELKAFEALVRADEREACVKECKKLIKVFLSSQYKTGQPLSSFGERHAVAACIEAIEARGTT